MYRCVFGRFARKNHPRELLTGESRRLIQWSNAWTELESCRSIKSAGVSQGDGAYVVYLKGVPQTVWCDMTTDGGGWMALINPEGMPSTMGAGATFFASTMSRPPDPSDNSCFYQPEEFAAYGWRGLNYNTCGHDHATLRISWHNTFGATDAMFIATAQGREQQLSVNAVTILPSARYEDPKHGLCWFWNGRSATMSPSENQCWTMYLDELPLIKTMAFSGDLQLTLTAGPACSPDCAYHAGMNLQKLFVR